VSWRQLLENKLWRASVGWRVDAEDPNDHAQTSSGDIAGVRRGGPVRLSHSGRSRVADWGVASGLRARRQTALADATPPAPAWRRRMMAQMAALSPSSRAAIAARIMIVTGGIDAADGKNNPAARRRRRRRLRIALTCPCTRTGRRDDGDFAPCRPSGRMALNIKLVAAPGQIDCDAPRIREQRKKPTVARRATVVGPRARAATRPKRSPSIRAAKLAERKRNLGASLSGMDGEIGQQGELGRDIGQCCGGRFGRLEDRLLAGGFDDVAHKRIKTGKR